MKKEYWWIVLIIIIATYLRVANIKSVPPGLYPDEAMNGNNALEALATDDFKVFYPENNGREGLFINIQALFLSLFGNEPWVLRLPSAIFGILTVLGIYFLTRELFKDKTLSLLAAFLLATSFWHIDFSRIGFRAIMAPFFLVWGIYFLLLSLRKAREPSRPKSYILYSIFSGIFYGLGFYSYIAYRATPIIIIFILALYFFEAKKGAVLKYFYRNATLFLISAFIVTIPLNIYFLENPQDFLGRTSQISVLSSETPTKDFLVNTLKTAGMFNFVGDWNWRHNIAGKPLLFWPIGITFLVGLVLSLRSLIKSDGLKTAAIILLAWLTVAAAPVVISNEGLPHALRAILMAPPVIIISSLGGWWLFSRLRGEISPNKLKAAALVMLTLITVEAYASYFMIWAKNPNTADAFSEDYVKLGVELNALPKEIPKFVIVNADGVDVRGMPMPAQTVMFITDTFRNEERANKNIRYLTPAELMETVFPENAFITYLN